MTIVTTAAPAPAPVASAGPSMSVVGTPSVGLVDGSQTPQQQRSVKRPRPVKSCTECRKRKLRCDRLCPCSQCQKSHRICKYAAEHDSSTISDSDGEGADPSHPAKRNCLATDQGIMRTNSTDHSISMSASRNGESASLSVVEELVSRLERLERQLLVRGGGTEVSSARSQRAGASPVTIRGLTIKEGAERTRFFGQNSPRVMLNLFGEAKDFMAKYTGSDGVRELFVSLQNLHSGLQEDRRKSLLPISLFVDSMIPIHKRMSDILPKKHFCDRLLRAYIETAESLYRMIHIPTFTEQYELFWEGQLQSQSFLPQLLCVLSIGSRFESKSKGLGQDRGEALHIPTACALVRSWLDGLRGKQLIELTTLQTEVLLSFAQRMITPRTQTSWMHLGSIVRMAMTMGLHRDPSEFEPRMSAFRGEMRRRLWFTILDMDLHISLACSLPCSIREGDHTCRPPQNFNDDELYPDMPELPLPKAIDEYTDNQIQTYASTTLGVRIRVAHLINRIDSIRDFQEVIDVGDRLESYLEDINYLFPRHGMLNDNHKSKPWRSRVVLDMHVRRTLLCLYRPFALGVPDVPPQIVRAYLRSSMVILKYLDELDPFLSHYQDVSDMYHLVLKPDIIQAAFSVCFYIRSIVRADPEARREQGLTPLDPIAETIAHMSDNTAVWSLPALVKTVQKTLDLLIRNVSGNDMKDITTLAVVFYSVQNLGQEQTIDDIKRGLRATLDNVMRSTNTSKDKLAALAVQYGQALPADAMSQQGTDPYSLQPQPRPSFLYNGSAAPAATANMGSWILWEGWDDDL